MMMASTEKNNLNEQQPEVQIVFPNVHSLPPVLFVDDAEAAEEYVAGIKSYYNQAKVLRYCINLTALTLGFVQGNSEVFKLLPEETKHD